MDACILHLWTHAKLGNAFTQSSCFSIRILRWSVVVLFSLLTRPLAWGWYGDITQCVHPALAFSSWTVLFTNSVPLSKIKISVTPYLKEIATLYTIVFKFVLLIEWIVVCNMSAYFYKLSNSSYDHIHNCTTNCIGNCINISYLQKMFSYIHFPIVTTHLSLIAPNSAYFVK